jgi:IS4 transposase
MLLQPLFDRFTQNTALTVMTRVLLERALQPAALDQLFDTVAEVQHTRELLFSNMVDVMSLVVTGFYRSPCAVHRDLPELFPVTLKSFYEKLKGIETPVTRALVQHSARQLCPVIAELKGALPPLLPGYRVKILDGNCLAGTQHRIKELRGLSAAALPGKSLVVLDPALRLALDMFPCEDGHAQERALIPEVLPTVEAADLWIEDRNFCTRGFLFGVHNRDAYVLVREHENLPWQAVTQLQRQGRTERGEVWQQTVRVSNDNGEVLFLRRIVIRLDQPTRDGDTEVALLTNLWDAKVDALTLARLYLQRWTIENVFLVLTETLECEQERLGYPKAALFGFGVTLAAYNVVATIKAALASAHGCQKVEETVSWYYVVEQVKRNYNGMMVALPAQEWLPFKEMPVEELAKYLRRWAQQVDLKRISKAKTRAKKPPTPRRHDPNVPHVSTAKVLAQRRQ